MISQIVKLFSRVVVLEVFTLCFSCCALEIDFRYDVNIGRSHLGSHLERTLNKVADGLKKILLTNYPKRWDRKFDVVIDVSLKDLDGVGGTLAQAGPTEAFWDSRKKLYYPSRGQMEIDIADLGNPGLRNIVTHEVLHVLGFGTLWEQNNLVGLDDQGNSYFIGSKAISVYSDLSGRPQTGVPLEMEGGSGTAGGHWSENIFTNELMTGFYNEEQVNPLSILTFAAFEDMGFIVNYRQAQPYNLFKFTNNARSKSLRASGFNTGYNMIRQYNCGHEPAGCSVLCSIM